VLWVWLRYAWPAWRDHLHIVEPATGTAKVGGCIGRGSQGAGWDGLA
jgi:hypothetical protein